MSVLCPVSGRTNQVAEPATAFYSRKMPMYRFEDDVSKCPEFVKEDLYHNRAMKFVVSLDPRNRVKLENVPDIIPNP